MPMGDKYSGLLDYLKRQTEHKIVLDFLEIEKLIEDTLPPSSYKHRQFWSNTSAHSVAYGWLGSEYETTSVNFEKLQVTFERNQ